MDVNNNIFLPGDRTITDNGEPTKPVIILHATDYF